MGRCAGTAFSSTEGGSLACALAGGSVLPLAGAPMHDINDSLAEEQHSFSRDNRTSALLLVFSCKSMRRAV